MLTNTKKNLSIDISKLENIARLVRRQLVDLSHQTKTQHLGSALSCVDILVALYWETLSVDPGELCDPERDRFILSKGHAVLSFYTVLANRGFFPLDQLEEFGQEGSHLEEHPALGCLPGVEASTGSLGHGLSLGVGMGLASRIQGHDYNIFVLLGDGECDEGSVWEAAMFAPVHQLDNLVVIIDYNKWQATGRSNEIMALESLKEKWLAFGWNAFEIDGNNMHDVVDLLKKTPVKNGKPTAIIAHTVKGKGFSFMEDDNNWHYRIPNEEEIKKAHKELALI